MNTNNTIYIYLIDKIKFLIYNFLVFIRFPSKKAFIYLFKMKLKKELIPLVSSFNFNSKKMNSTYNKIILLLKLSKKLEIDAPILYLLTSIADYITGKIDNWKKHRTQYINQQNKKIFKFQKKGEKILIIEPGLITHTIGTSFNLDAWIKSKILGFQDDNKLILPIIPSLKNKIINPCMLNYFNNYIDIIYEPNKANYYYSLLDDLKCLYDEYIPCGKEKEIVPYAHSTGVYIQSIWDKKNKDPLFKLNNDHELKGHETIKKMGIPEDSWFVTCHVREPHFKHREDFRDSDIATYFDAFKEITDRGGWVVRMGDKSMSPLPKMNRVIDYAISEFKSDWMDIFLLADAKFILGCSSGPTTVAYAFGTPIVMTNNLPTAGTYLSKRDLFMPRLMQRLDNGKMISLVDSMTIPYSLGFSDSIYKNIFKVKTIPNNNIEIKNITIEMLERLDGSIKYSSADENLQSEFKKKTAEKEVMIGFPGFPIQCRLGNYFLQNNI